MKKITYGIKIYNPAISPFQGLLFLTLKPRAHALGYRYAAPSGLKTRY